MNLYKRIYCLSFIILTAYYSLGCTNPLKPEDPLAMQTVDMPMPKVISTDGAIYSTNSDAYLYGSSRAHRVGDLLTVHINEDTDAQGSVVTNSGRTTGTKDSLSLNGAINFSGLALEGSGTNAYSGLGNSHQANKISSNITVNVIKVLPNGNLVIKGYKTITLSNGVEKIGVSGIVKEQDIDSTDNSVLSSQIADAHIAYLGHGDIHRAANKGWLSSIFSSNIWPF